MPPPPKPSPASAPARRDFETLLGAAIPAAQELLAKYGEFFPFAAALTVGGEPQLLAAEAGRLGDRPAAHDVIEACLAALSARRDALRAAAIVVAARTADGDAIRVELEHADDSVLVILLPYAAGAHGLEYGSLHAAAGRSRIWVSGVDVSADIGRAPGAVEVGRQDRDPV